ncbi:MAG: fluoride efflux transporter CrcB [Planctomycetes bacterium]|nr:fluoride efflux transporter CrcB [Planctomycetota bacterium]MCB9905589.1 fluoride efflux transporter CrcB [Planctomycetota bacterium]
MTRLLIVGLGGALGAIARYGLSGYIQRRSPQPFPWHTLSVNVLGCLILGVLIALGERRHLLEGEWGFFLRIGVLGSLTTFSTFGMESVELMRAGDWSRGLGNVALSLMLGFGAYLLGRGVVTWLAA